MNLRFRALNKAEKKLYNVKAIYWLVTTNGDHEIDMLHLVDIDAPDKTGRYCTTDEVDLIVY